MKKTMVVLTAVATLALSACGGGGGDAPASTATPTPSPSPIPSPDATAYVPYTLQASVPAFDYPATVDGGNRRNQVTRLNEVRATLGLGLLKQNAALDQAAQAHAAYLVENRTSGHDEISTYPGFTGATVAARVAAAGYSGTATEVVSGLDLDSETEKADPANCVSALLDAPYHTAALLGAYREVGVGLVKGSADYLSYRCVLVLGYAATERPQQPDSPAVRAYPYEGQLALQPFAMLESPDPIPDLSTETRGHWIHVSLESFESLPGVSPAEVESFTIKDSAGNLLASRVWAAADVKAKAGSNIDFYRDPLARVSATKVFLLPLARLQNGSTYTVSFAGSISGKAVSKTWTFTTR